ncbi:hypothetical protein E4Q23_05035 [Candidatus Accumulibacter phosphatis]|jgi:hypothetical protein|uniref:Carboxypeptidase regulatory-like domain-containing protein n=1 Tax=Candidatus Accumulibacter phosphatis TaxID=327160 RepID=A0ABX1TVR8_9PROT|nr:hypothetical protein [Candidatus Accumulibacter phosphatis]NMQ27174.1 hypothetical protein [Candidatus Accumulibacter phosphatis]
MPGSAKLVSRALLLVSVCLLPVAQALAAELEPQRDVHVSFSTEGSEKGAGFVVGEVSKVGKTARHDFSCVFLDFGLFTRFDQKAPGQPSQRLGMLSVEVKDLGSQTTVAYRKALPFPAGIRLEKISTCDSDAAKQAAKEAARNPAKETAKESAKESANEPEKKAGPPQILSFKVTPDRVQRGGSVNLSWEVQDADGVRLFDDSGEVETRNLVPGGQRGRPLSISGSESLSIDKATTFRLLAVDRQGRRVAATTTVRLLNGQSVSCRIFGKVSGTPVRIRLSPAGPLETFKLTHVGVFVPGERQPALSTRVDAQGSYSFPNVPGNQEFRVGPLGPNWLYEDSNERVSCLAGKSFRVDFAIKGVRAD